MKIAIYGAGAVGSLFGAYLSKYHKVTLIARKEHVEKINTHGLIIKGRTNDVFKLKASENYEGGADVIFLTVKSYDTENAMIKLKDILTDEIIISLQNGLDNIDIIKKYYNKRIGAGITTEGITFEKPGEIIHTGNGITKLGNVENVDKNIILEIVESLNKSGLKSEYSLDIVKEIWIKGFINACINPLTAILKAKNGDLIKAPLLNIFNDLCKEIEILANIIGINENIYNLSYEVAKNTSDNYSSMLQDILKNKRTEIDHITGIILKLAREYNLRMPINETLYNMVKYMEENYGKQ